jgi:replicative DNA helicase
MTEPKTTRAELDGFLAAQHKKYLTTLSKMREAAIAPIMTADDVWERRAMEKHYDEHPILSGVEWWDSITGPFRRGNLYVMAGYAGVGKTTMSLQLAWNIAKQNRKVWYYCLELTPVEILEVLTSHIVGDDELNDAKYMIALSQIQNSGFRFFDSTKHRSWEEHLAIIESGVNNHGVEFVVIDNFHFLTRVSKNNLEVEGVVSQRLKGLSQSCNVPILLLHHLRKPESDATEPEPTVHAMRGASAILNDASTVMLLHHPLTKTEGEEDGSRQSVGKLKHGKARWGKGGTRYVRLIGFKRLYEQATMEEYGGNRTRRRAF